MIEVLAIPPLATVQDLGRDGYWHQGLGRAGAMDALALAVANLLLGNDRGVAGLEIPLTPARLRFTRKGAFAIAGAACRAKLDGISLPQVWAGPVMAGQILDLGPINRGARVYITLPGGVDVPPVLNSHSTQLREAFGGFAGRALRAGDIIEAARKEADIPRPPLSIQMPASRAPGEDVITLRALPSTEHDSFAPQARTAFWSTPYQVTEKSNRQGFRLSGTELARDDTGELRSHGIVPGIVQVPGGGQPIIQLADSATMGGYPKIAAVIEPDLWRIAQAGPGALLQFRQVTLNEAAEAETEQRRWLAALEKDLAVLAEQLRGWASHV
ncbi:MAG: biotin-dependent carboxyltransferase family protein [Paracoccus sp. (in: a-proteobacteria)]|nr:biotin-dependent carboxyltransferase family protein [Paracoccus sp. (in: a-proteobacteria)]